MICEGEFRVFEGVSGAARTGALQRFFVLGRTAIIRLGALPSTFLDTLILYILKSTLTYWFFMQPIVLDLISTFPE